MDSPTGRILITYLVVCVIFISWMAHIASNQKNEVAILNEELDLKDDKIEEVKKELQGAALQIEAYEKEIKALKAASDAQLNYLYTLSDKTKEQNREIRILEAQVEEFEESLRKKIPNVSLSNIEIGNWFDWNMTYYSLDYASTGKKPGDKGYGITRSGREVREEHTIACPQDELFFPKKNGKLDFRNGYFVEIDGIGIRQCEDTGSAITMAKKRIDMYIPNKDTKWLLSKGVDQVRIRILKPL